MRAAGRDDAEAAAAPVDAVPPPPSSPDLRLADVESGEMSPFHMRSGTLGGGAVSA